MVTATGAFAKAWVAHRPPKPEPMITTRCRPDPGLVAAGVAGLGAGDSTVMTHSSLSPCGLPRTAAQRRAGDQATAFINPPMVSNSPNWLAARAMPTLAAVTARIGHLSRLQPTSRRTLLFPELPAAETYVHRRFLRRGAAKPRLQAAALRTHGSFGRRCGGSQCPRLRCGT